jgi:hypothetical protein
MPKNVDAGYRPLHLKSLRHATIVAPADEAPAIRTPTGAQVAAVLYGEWSVPAEAVSPADPGHRRSLRISLMLDIEVIAGLQSRNQHRVRVRLAAVDIRACPVGC